VQQVLRSRTRTCSADRRGVHPSGDRAINEKGIPPDVPLFPVAKASLGALANVPEGAIPYLRATGEDDRFPVDAAAIYLTQPREQALAEIKKRAYAGIAPELAKLGVTWVALRPTPDAPLAKPLEIKADAAPFRAGEPGKLRVTVKNPNDAPLPDVWLALGAPAEYLDNKVIALGTLGAGETKTGEVELTAPDGISVAHHPIDVLAASATAAAREAADRARGRSRPAELEIGRAGQPRPARVTLTNKSPHRANQLTVAVPGATRSLDELAAGATQTLDLPLPAQPKTIVVAQSGPWAQRRVDVPLPEKSATYTIPEVVLDERANEVAMTARTSEGGLRDGWIALDGQKKALAAFDGKSQAELDVPIAAGEHDLIGKIETDSGIAVIDARHLTRD
jgi:hypothetical protein